MKTGKIKISKSVISKVKQLPFRHIPHKHFPTSWGKYPKKSLIHLEFGSKTKKYPWFDQFKPLNSKNVGYLFSKLESGHVVPPHKDHFKNFAKYHKVALHKIKRRLVFIEDWKSGHFFQVNDKVFTNWRSGDFVEWQQKDIHLGGNFGLNPRYVLQITYY